MMAELVSLLGLGISIIAAQLITTRSTQNILRSNQRILDSNQRILEEIRGLARQNQKILEEIYDLQKEMALCLRKIDVGMRANALMHGWQRVDGISPEEARRLPEPKVYDEKLQICYYKPN
ncbi:MAG: hypothetical protein QXG14_01350 [Candidatus Hadarchaeales archaeon]